MDYKALSEQLQKDCDAEHQRYLEVQENYSWRLCEVCEYLGIDNDDTSEKIIKEIKRDREEKNDEIERLEQDIVAYENTETDDIADIAELQAENEKLKAEIEKFHAKHATAVALEHVRRVMEQNVKLKKENEKLKAS